MNLLVETPFPPQNPATFASAKATANLHITQEPTWAATPPKTATFATDSHKCYISLRLGNKLKPPKYITQMERL